jgi:MOSC domain-containing protein YiiM
VHRHRYRIGEALFEVTPAACDGLPRRHLHGRARDADAARRSPSSGFYFRVLDDGLVQAGDEIVKVADGPEQLTVGQSDALLYLSNIRALCSNAPCASRHSARGGREALKKRRRGAFLEWRDPDSNWGHHDFSRARRSGLRAQIPGSYVVFAGER